MQKSIVSTVVDSGSITVLYILTYNSERSPFETAIPLKPFEGFGHILQTSKRACGHQRKPWIWTDSNCIILLSVTEHDTQFSLRTSSIAWCRNESKHRLRNRIRNRKMVIFCTKTQETNSTSSANGHTSFTPYWKHCSSTNSILIHPVYINTSPASLASPAPEKCI